MSDSESPPPGAFANDMPPRAPVGASDPAPRAQEQAGDAVGTLAAGSLPVTGSAAPSPSQPASGLQDSRRDDGAVAMATSSVLLAPAHECDPGTRAEGQSESSLEPSQLSGRVLTDSGTGGRGPLNAEVERDAAAHATGTTSVSLPAASGPLGGASALAAPMAPPPDAAASRGSEEVNHRQQPGARAPTTALSEHLAVLGRNLKWRQTQAAAGGTAGGTLMQRGPGCERVSMRTGSELDADEQLGLPDGYPYADEECIATAPDDRPEDAFADFV